VVPPRLVTDAKEDRRKQRQWINKSMTNMTRVLIVEDDINIARVLTIRLERLGYQIVGVVDNGIAAIREPAQRSRTSR